MLMPLLIKQDVRIMERGGSLDLNCRLIRTPPRIASYRLVRASLRMRSCDLVGAVILQHLIHARNKPMKHQDRVR